MTVHCCWDPGLVDAYFQVDVNVVIKKYGWDVFEKLHYPINRIRVVSGEIVGLGAESGYVNGEATHFINEEALLHVIEGAPASQNTLIGVRGAAGSGKSHLIRWLEFKLRDDPRFRVIPIPREMNSAVAVLNEVARVAGLTDVPFPTGVVDPQRVENIANETFLLRAVNHHGAEKALLLWDGLKPIVVDAVERAFAAPDSERESRLPRLDRLKITDRFKGSTDPARHKDADAAYDMVDSYFAAAWMYCLLGGIAFDFTAFMKRISEACAADGRRPVLLLEDATSFGILHRELFHFIASLTSSNFISVIGWTTAYEAEWLGQENLRERLRFHLSVSEPDGGAGERTFAFEDPKDAVGLAQRYLDAVRQPCGKHGPGNPFPFTVDALERFYGRLWDAQAQVGRFTPRIYLVRVLQPLLFAATQEQRFPRMSNVSYLRPIPDTAALNNYRPQYPDWVDLQVWFSKDGVEFDRDYLDDLGVRTPDELRHVPYTAPAAPTLGDSALVTSSTETFPEPAPAGHDPRLELFAAESQKLDVWREGKPLLSADAFVDLARTALRASSRTNFAGADVYGIRFAAGTVVAIDGASAAAGAPGLVTIPRNDAGKRVLRGLVRFRIYQKFESPAEAAYVHAQLARWRVSSTDVLREALTTERPVAGLALTLLNWWAAMSGGGAARADQFGIVRAAVQPAATNGAPLLGAKGTALRTQLTTNEEMLRKILLEMARAANQTLDLGFLQLSLEAHQRRQFDAGSTRLHDVHIGPALAGCAASLREFEQQKLAPEDSLFREMRDVAVRTPGFGLDPVGVLRDLREEYMKFRDAGRTVMVWGNVQPHRPLLEQGGPTLDHCVDTFRAGVAAVLDEADPVLRLAGMARLDPARVKLALAAANALADLGGVVRHELDLSAGSEGEATNVVQTALAHSNAAVAALRGEAVNG